MIALKRLWTLLCALLLLPAAALAELTWPDGATGGQQALQAYIARVNDNLAQQGSRQVNSLFEYYTGFAVLGVTAKDMAEVPDEAADEADTSDEPGFETGELDLSLYRSLIETDDDELDEIPAAYNRRESDEMKE